MIVIQAMTVMLICLLDAGSPAGDAKAALVGGVLNWTSHQAPIANGTPNTTAIIRRRPCSIPGGESGGSGMTAVITSRKMEPTARSPANTRIEVRAHGLTLKRPTAVQMPTAAKAAQMTAPPMTAWAVFGGLG